MTESTELDPYATLGVPETADSEAVRAAYRRHARRCHPDSVGPGHEASMKEVNAAWEQLKTPARRARYDATRKLGRAESVATTEAATEATRPTPGSRNEKVPTPGQARRTGRPSGSNVWSERNPSTQPLSSRASSPPVQSATWTQSTSAQRLGGVPEARRSFGGSSINAKPEWRQTRSFLAVHFAHGLARRIRRVAAPLASATSLPAALRAAGILGLLITLLATLRPATLATATDALLSTVFNLVEIPIVIFLLLLVVDVLHWMSMRGD